MTTLRAFFIEDGKFWKDPEDGEMSMHSDKQWWMFPEGVEVGCPVQYYETLYKASSENRWSSVVDFHTALFAMGSVSSIAGDLLTFTMEGAVRKWRERDGGCRTGEEGPSKDVGDGWCLAEVPNSVSRLEAITVPGVQSISRQQEAKWIDDEVIPVDCDAKSAYDSLVEVRDFVVVLSAIGPEEDGHLEVTLGLLSGEQLSISIEAGSSTQTLANLVRKLRGLKDDTSIKFVNADGAIVQVEAALFKSRMHHTQTISRQMTDEAVDIKAAFLKLDQNNDGYISRRELEALFVDLDPKQWTREQLDGLFESVDTDGDGRLKYGEFVDWLFSTNLILAEGQVAAKDQAPGDVDILKSATDDADPRAK